MTSPAASSRHLSRFEKRTKMPHATALFALSIMQCGIKPNAVLKASSNLLSEEYRQRFRTKRPGAPYSLTLWWASCSKISLSTRSAFLNWNSNVFLHIHVVLSVSRRTCCQHQKSECRRLRIINWFIDFFLPFLRSSSLLILCFVLDERIKIYSKGTGGSVRRRRNDLI